MRVLAVDQNAILRTGRGVWRKLDAMAGCEIIVVAPRRWNESGLENSFEKEETKLRVVSSSVLFPGKSHRAIYPYLKAIVKQYTPDVLYINAEPESFLAWQAARLKQRFLAMKLVFMSWRNIDYPVGDYPYKLPFLNARAENATLNCADCCIAHNQTAKQIFSRKGFRNIVVIPPSVDSALFAPQLQDDDSRLSTLFTLGYIGRLIPGKGIDILLRAAAELAYDYRIQIVGDGPAKQSLKELARRLGIGNRIEWVGAVGHQDMPQQFGRMDVLVLPSLTSKYWKEQFGRVLIEAMACGVPVIGSDSGEIPAVIGDSGLVFKEGSVEGLKLGLARLHSDEGLRRQLVIKGLQRVASEFDTRQVARLYWELFSSLKP